MTEKRYFLPRKFKEKFIKALKSGKYKQCKNTLTKLSKDGTRQYCCLGVACIISGYNNDQIKSFVSIPDNFNQVPFNLLDEICLNDNVLLPSVLSGRLIQMNDGYVNDLRNFNEIADWIKNNVGNIK